MKTVFRFWAPLLLCAALLALAGCSLVDFFSTDTLLRAPKLTGENAALQQAFENTVGQDTFLVGPLTGDYRSAYIRKDCNLDGVEEAVVFYSLQGAENTVRINLLENVAGEWRSVADLAGNGSEVYKVEFCNIDRDRDLELAVTWTVSDTKRDKTLSLYKIDLSHTEIAEVLNPLASVQVYDYFVLDVDKDAQNELFYVYFDATEEKNGAYAKLLKYAEADTVLFPVSEVKFDTRASSLLSVRYDYKGGTYTFFADCAAGENAYYTEVIRYDRETASLSLPVKAMFEDPVAQTRRSTLLYASDIDGDGQTEIPAERTMADSYVLNYPETESTPLRYISWLRYTEDGFDPAENDYVNDVYGYTLRLDPVLGPLYIVSDYMTGEVQFRSKTVYNEEGEGAEDLLFTLAPEEKGEEGRPESGNAAAAVRVTVTDLGKNTGITKKLVESLIETGAARKGLER